MVIVIHKRVPLSASWERDEIPDNRYAVSGMTVAFYTVSGMTVAFTRFPG